MKYILNIQLLEKIYFIDFDIYLTYIFFPCGRDRILHYLPRQVKFYSLSFHVIHIKRLFQRNKLLYYLERCPFTDYVG